MKELEPCHARTRNYHEAEALAVDAWNTRAERTCENVGEETDFSCSECGARLYIEICGDYTMILEDEITLVTMPHYCPNCGARVIGVVE